MSDKTRLKDSTIFNILTTLKDLGRVRSLDFALAYWPDKKMSGSMASKVGSNILWKVEKYGFIHVMRRSNMSSGVFVFEVSPEGLEFLNQQGGNQ